MKVEKSLKKLCICIDNILKNSSINPSSTDKNSKIVKPNVMIGVQTPTPPHCVCDFMMVLLFHLSKKTSIKKTILKRYL